MTMEDWTPKVPTARFGIDHTSEGDRHVCAIVQGAKILHTLQDGEDWHLHPAGGVIVAHPDRAPVWVREVGGQVVREVIEPAPPMFWVNGYCLPMKES